MTEELTKRVGKLERENRLLKIVFFLVLFMLSVMLFIGATKWDREIVTENLKIVDKKGNTRIKLSGDAEGAGIPAITLYDSEEEPRLVMVIYEDGAPGISFFDSEGELRLGIIVSEDGTLKIGLFDSGQKQRLGMSVSEDGTSQISLLGSKGKDKLGMLVAENEMSVISLHDSKGELRLSMGILEDRDPFLWFFGPDGNVICALP